MTSVIVDEQRYDLFSGQYRFDDKLWTVHVYARDWQEAQDKLFAMGGGLIDGQVVAEGRAPGLNSLFKRVKGLLWG